MATGSPSWCSCARLDLRTVGCCRASVLRVSPARPPARAVLRPQLGAAFARRLAPDWVCARTPLERIPRRWADRSYSKALAGFPGVPAENPGVPSLTRRPRGIELGSPNGRSRGTLRGGVSSPPLRGTARERAPRVSSACTPRHRVPSSTSPVGVPPARPARGEALQRPASSIPYRGARLGPRWVDIGMMSKSPQRAQRIIDNTMTILVHSSEVHHISHSSAVRRPTW